MIDKHMHATLVCVIMTSVYYYRMLHGDQRKQLLTPVLLVTLSYF